MLLLEESVDAEVKEFRELELRLYVWLKISLKASLVWSDSDGVYCEETDPLCASHNKGMSS